MEPQEDLILSRPPTALRPLLGLTVLIVEDSRFVCEAVRLLCLRSGARIRRADNLEHARRHLSVYRPSVLIADIGLPDGSGMELISTLSETRPRIDVILGTSGDPDQEQAIMAAGADGFLAKPIASIAAFQSAILAHLPADRQPPGPRLLSTETVAPDRVAYYDDLSHVAQVLTGQEEKATVDYVTQFLSGVTLSADDADLNRAAAALAEKCTNNEPLRPGIAQLAAMVQSRLTSNGPI